MFILCLVLKCFDISDRGTVSLQLARQKVLQNLAGSLLKMRGGLSGFAGFPLDLALEMVGELLSVVILRLLAVLGTYMLTGLGLLDECGIFG